MLDLSKVYACTLHFPKDEDVQRSREIALQEDRNNASRSSGYPTTAQIPHDNVDSDVHDDVILRMGLYTEKMWKPGRTLRVLLRGGTLKVRAKVMEKAVIWSQYANIKFQFVSALPAEIRVGFNKGGSWSKLGTDSLLKPTEDSMNFGWFTDNTDDAEFSRTTLHEFGHALGCVHEQSQPNANIHWNKPVVYDYYWRTAKWTKEDVDYQVFRHFESYQVQSTAFDKLSIMQYAVDKTWTTNGFSVGYNNYLSEEDKAYIRKMYPPTRTQIYTGSVNTMSVRPWQNPKHENKISVTFDSASQTPQTVLLGLNWLDIGCNGNLRIKADLESLQSDRMRINLHSWADTTMYSTGCAWLRLPSDNYDLQTGTFSTMDDHLWYKPQANTSRRITFQHRYAKPPTVLVWLNALDVDQNANCRVKAYATNITADGFTVHVNSWSNTSLYLGRISYLAFPTDRTDMCGGTYSTSDVRNWWDPKPNNSAHTTFSKHFDKPPHVFMALNSLDMQNGKNLRIKLSSKNVSKAGMTWHIDSWGDTQMYLGGVTYLAIADDS